MGRGRTVSVRFLGAPPRAGRTGSRPRLLCCAAVLAVAGTAGCFGSPQTHDATDADRARGDALLADPWLDASQITLTRYAGSTDDLYLPTTTTVYRPAPDGLAEVLRDEVAQARDAGWWPFYAQCDGVQDGPSQLHGRIGVVLARELPDGSSGQAVMTDGPEGFTIVATAANHDMAQPTPPAEVDVTAVACLSPDGSGPEQVGDPVDLTQDW